MIRKLTVISLVVSLCLMGVIPALAQKTYPTLTDYEKLTGEKIEKFYEAPELRIEVAKGTLPPVEERLPEEPVVIEPVEEIGQYGGTWHRVALSPGDTCLDSRMGYESLVQWTPDAKDVEPGIAKSWKISEEGKVFTFYLRKGMKWSDGKPFTADDFLFWYEDILLNKELTPVFPGWLKVGGEPVKIEKVNDYTIKFQFVKPYGLFLQMLAFNGPFCGAPKHYLKQFHPKYMSKERLEKLTKEAGFESWYQLFLAKNNLYTNPELPTIRPWKLTVPPPATRLIAERNPYYWKVDTEGNQLPYIDRVVFNMVESTEMANMKALTGEIDMQHRHMMLSNYTVFMKNREKGNYRVLRWEDAYGTNCAILLNQSCKDPVLRDLFQNLKFRIALSLAINREEINELCFQSLGVPRAATQIPASPYYQRDLENIYADYDPEKANRLLDEIGLTKRDKEGYRLRPDGKRLSLVFSFCALWGPYPDIAQLVKEYWEAIGIKVVVKTLERSLRTKRVEANEHETDMWCIPGYLLLNPWPYIAVNQYTPYGPLYGRWYASEGKQGEEPPEYILHNMRLYDKFLVTVDPEKQLKIGKEIVRHAAKNLYAIGTVGRLPALVIVKNNFRNVPEKAVSAWTLMTPGYTHIEQYFIKQ